MPDRRHIRWLRLRLMGVVGFLSLCLLAVLWRVAELQIVQVDWLRGLAREQYLKEIALEPMRGSILDRNGNPLALSIMTDSLFAVPGEVADGGAAARRLAPILDIPEATLKKKLTSRKQFVWLKRRMPPDEAERVRSLKVTGLHFTRESRRFYPARELGASVIGFAGDGRGLEGLELLFEGVLRGTQVMAQGLRDARQQVLLANGLGEREAGGGGTVVTTLDLTLQEIAERELARAVSEAQAAGGSVVVMDPATGEILALANLPGFNPNTFGKARPEQRRNRALTDCFEPGSTLKSVILAEALESGLVRPGESIDCRAGSLLVNNHVINDSHPQNTSLPLREVLVRSSNVGMARIGLRLGRERLHAALQRWGFGQRSQTSFPGEAACPLRPARQWPDLEVATAAFGQGVSVTALQLAAAYGALANGGVWMQPLLVREIRGPRDQLWQRFEPEPLGRLASEKTVQELRNMLEGVVGPGGTGTAAAVAGFRVAGKTGTAQKADTITGGYSKDKRIASFIGFVPADRPRLVILVVVDEPTTSPYGGVVAAPAFARIAQEALPYLGVFPDPLAARAPTAVGSAAAPVRESLPLLDDEPEPEAQPGSGSGVTVPDVRGLSLREALRRMAPRGLEVAAQGYGRVSRQSPSAGTVVAGGRRVQLVLDSGEGGQP